MGVDFRQDNFCQVIDPAGIKSVDADKLQERMRSSIQAQYSGYLESYIEDDIKRIPRLIKDEIDALNIKDKLIKHNMYISCVLSFINTTTLSKRDMTIIERRFKKNQLNEAYVMSLYAKSANEPIIL